MYGGGCVFTGAVTASIKIGYVIDLFEQLGKDVRLIIHTSDASRAVLEPKEEGNGKTVLRPWVPSEELSAIYAAADCLISIGETEGRQLSSKIFSYMSAGKPIIHFYAKECDANLPYLDKYPLALLLPVDRCKMGENAKLISLFLMWSKGKSVSFPDVEATLPECTPTSVCVSLEALASQMRQ